MWGGALKLSQQMHLSSSQKMSIHIHRVGDRYIIILGPNYDVSGEKRLAGYR